MVVFVFFVVFFDVEFYVLYMDVGVDEFLEMVVGKIYVFGDGFDCGLDVFVDIVVVIVKFDLIVICDMLIVYFVGVFGCFVWVMLCYIVEWCWMCDCVDLFWYLIMCLMCVGVGDDWFEFYDCIVNDIVVFV